MGKLFQYRLMCILSLICIGLYALVTVRYGFCLFHANAVAKQWMHQLEQRDIICGSILEQLVELDSEVVHVLCDQELMPAEYDDMKKSIEGLEKSLLLFSENFGRTEAEQAAQKQMDQLVQTGNELLSSPESVEPERRDGYQAAIQQCIDSMESIRAQSHALMVERIAESQDDVFRLGMFLAIAIVVSLIVNIIVLVVLKQAKARLAQG